MEALMVKVLQLLLVDEILTSLPQVEGLKKDAEQKEVLQEVLQKDVADREVEAGAHLLGQGRFGEDKPSVVSLLVKQRDVTSL